MGVWDESWVVEKQREWVGGQRDAYYVKMCEGCVTDLREGVYKV